MQILSACWACCPCYAAFSDYNSPSIKPRGASLEESIYGSAKCWEHKDDLGNVVKRLTWWKTFESGLLNFKSLYLSPQRFRKLKTRYSMKWKVKLSSFLNMTMSCFFFALICADKWRVLLVLEHFSHLFDIF